MRRIITMTFVLVLGFALTLSAQDKKFQYVGVKKCKTCHNTAKIGKQFDVWAGMSHAKAMESLASEKSLAYAKEKGIADPTKDASCLSCHATAASVDKALLTDTITMEEGVSCESCHGPGSEYKSMKIMKDKATALGNGLIEPTEKVCVTCHNEKNPFHKPFDFKTASAKIAHPIPK